MLHFPRHSRQKSRPQWAYLQILIFTFFLSIQFVVCLVDSGSGKLSILSPRYWNVRPGATDFRPWGDRLCLNGFRGGRHEDPVCNSNIFSAEADGTSVHWETIVIVSLRMYLSFPWSRSSWRRPLESFPWNFIELSPFLNRPRPWSPISFAQSGSKGVEFPICTPRGHLRQ
jgi:hypothetical protein